MFHKRARPDVKDLPPEQRLQMGMGDLFLSNQVSGQQTQGLFNDAAEIPGLSNFKPFKGPAGRNSKRNLLKKMLKGKLWPKHYTAMITCYDRRTQQPIKRKLNFQLPHEILPEIAKVSDVSRLCDSSRLCSEDLAHYNTWKQKLNATNLVAVGLWIDGTPCNWDRSDSLESVCMNLPGNSATDNLRIPLTGITKRHLLKQQSFDEILEVVAWSFRCLAEGKYPECRHDGSDFQSALSDSRRSKKSGQSLGLQGLLTEARGDWKMYKETFRLPGWQDKGNCCSLVLLIFGEGGENLFFRRGRIFLEREGFCLVHLVPRFLQWGHKHFLSSILSTCKVTNAKRTKLGFWMLALQLHGEKRGSATLNLLLA